MPEAFGLTNGLLPVAGMMALAVLLPMPFARWAGLSQRRLAALMLLTALALAGIATIVLKLLTELESGQAPVLSLVFALRSVKIALAWGPVWALVWLMRAQGIERRRGLTMREAER